MGGEPVAVSAMLPEALGKSEERTLILGWAYYLYAFSSYPLRGMSSPGKVLRFASKTRIFFFFININIKNKQIEIQI
jgi:hypothetical protein